MNNKRIGITFVVISVVLAFFIIHTMGGLNTEAEKLGCFSDDSCEEIQQQISLTHLGFGLIGFLGALGVYLLIFSPGDQALLDKINAEHQRLTEEQRFSLLLKGLNAYERRALEKIREQDGITQATLRLRTDMSKAKLSYVLQDLEAKHLIKKVPKGKTHAIFLSMGV